MFAISDMKPKAQIETLQSICQKLKEHATDTSPDVVEFILTALVDALDETDGDDAFGTEGWKQFFGFED